MDHFDRPGRRTAQMHNALSSEGRKSKIYKHACYVKYNLSIYQTDHACLLGLSRCNASRCSQSPTYNSAKPETGVRAVGRVHVRSHALPTHPVQPAAARFL